MATKSFIDRMVEYYQLLSDGDPIFMRFGAAQLIGFFLVGHILRVYNDGIRFSTTQADSIISISEILSVRTVGV